MRRRAQQEGGVSVGWQSVRWPDGSTCVFECMNGVLGFNLIDEIRITCLCFWNADMKDW